MKDAGEPTHYPDSSVGKESTCNAGYPSLIPGLGRSAGEEIGGPTPLFLGFPVAQLAENLPAMQETWVKFNSWVGKIPWRRERLPTSVFWPREFHGLYPMKFSRQEYWSGLPFPNPGDLPDSGIKPKCLESPELVGGLFTTERPGNPC